MVAHAADQWQVRGTYIAVLSLAVLSVRIVDLLRVATGGQRCIHNLALIKALIVFVDSS